MHIGWGIANPEDAAYMRNVVQPAVARIGDAEGAHERMLPTRDRPVNDADSGLEILANAPPAESKRDPRSHTRGSRLVPVNGSEDSSTRQ